MLASRTHLDRQDPPATCVLVVDDEHELRELVAETLRRRGYRVLEASDGREAIDIFYGRESPSVDIIVSDIRMSGESGMSALETIRYGNERTPVILMTAYPDEAVMREAANRGAAALLAKPLDLRALAQLVHRLAPTLVQRRHP